MALKDQPTLRIVLNEGEGTIPFTSAERFLAVSALLDKGYAVSCPGTARPPNLPGSRSTLVIGRLGGRAPTGAGIHPEGEVAFTDVSGVDPQEIPSRVQEHQVTGGFATPGAWKPWFPVIDYDRCTNCMQCLSFCLFGVYGVSAGGRIEVQSSESCKTNCPACSRVCPEAAIVFPKYKAGPINGDVVHDTDLAREKMKIDISALLGGDVYSLLRERSERAKSRFAKERDPDQALQERRKCLTKLMQAADIPPEVLMSLPSMDEIQRRAAEAKAKAEAALGTAPAP